jgi:hypothetical protein
LKIDPPIAPKRALLKPFVNAKSAIEDAPGRRSLSVSQPNPRRSSKMTLWYFAASNDEGVDLS